MVSPVNSASSMTQTRALRCALAPAFTSLAGANAGPSRKHWDCGSDEDDARRLAAPQFNTQRTPASLAIRFETALPVINPAGNPPPGEIHWPTM